MGAPMDEKPTEKPKPPAKRLAPSYLLYVALLSALFGAQLLRIAEKRPDLLSRRMLLSTAAACLALVAAFYLLWRIRRAKKVKVWPLLLAILPGVALAAFLATLPDRLLDRQAVRAYGLLTSLRPEAVESVRVYRPSERKEALTIADEEALRRLASACGKLERYPDARAAAGERAHLWNVVIEGPERIEMRCYEQQQDDKTLVLELVKQKADRTIVYGKYVGKELEAWFEENVRLPLATTAPPASEQG